MQIRTLQATDASEYRALRLRALGECPDAFTSSHEEEAAKPVEWSAQRLTHVGSTFWGAFSEGGLCGMVGLEREARAKTRHKAKVVGMYVATEAAGNGIGRALLDALIADTRREGLELLVLTVTHGNTRAATLYERAGFRAFGVEPRAIKLEGKVYAKTHMYLELDAA